MVSPTFLASTQNEGAKKKEDMNPAKQVTTATSVVAGGSGTTGQQPGDLNYPRSGPARSRDLA